MDDLTPCHGGTDAERTTRIIANLEGVLQEQTLGAMAAVWSVLEQAATDDVAHARAVRSRLFWQTMTPGEARTAGPASVHELAPRLDGAAAGSAGLSRGPDEVQAAAA